MKMSETNSENKILPQIKFERLDAFLDKYGLSGSALKIIAIITMLIDHAAWVFIPEYYSPEGTVLHTIGRLAFPIFAFLFAEGMQHTKNIYRYALRCLIFALISEIPYDLVFYGEITLEHGNVMFTFFLAVIFECVLRWANTNPKKILAFITGILCVIAADAFHPDYGAYGVLIVWLFYYLRSLNQIRIIIVAAAALFFYKDTTLQQYLILAFPLLLLYNGKRGFIKTKAASIACYAFYPVHMIILWALPLLVR